VKQLPTLPKGTNRPPHHHLIELAILAVTLVIIVTSTGSPEIGVIAITPLLARIGQ
jgi:hypothetical protein